MFFMFLFIYLFIYFSILTVFNYVCVSAFEQGHLYPWRSKNALIIIIIYPVCRHLHFKKCNNICHFSDHLINLSRSFCKCCLSQSLLTFLNTFGIRKFQYFA